MRSESTRLSSDGLSSLTLRGAGKASRVTALVETGYRHAIGSLAVTPRTQLAYSRTNLSGFNEQGGETALKLDSLDQQRFEGRVGARLDGRTTFGSWTFAPSLQADYVRLLSGGANGMTVRFAAAPDAAILLPLNGGGKGWAELKGGLALTRGAVSIGLTGNAAVGDSPYADQRGAMNLTFRF
jgi:outer membrane autotransporter protein